MNAVQREIFEDLGRELDGWVRVATEAVSGENPDLTWAGEAAPAIKRMRQSLTSPDLVRAYEVSLRKILAGLLHSVMVSFDGGTQLADKLRVRLATDDGQEIGPGLNELLFEHLHDTGRLPATSSSE